MLRVVTCDKFYENHLKVVLRVATCHIFSEKLDFAIVLVTCYARWLCGVFHNCSGYILCEVVVWDIPTGSQV